MAVFAIIEEIDNRRMKDVEVVLREQGRSDGEKSCFFDLLGLRFPAKTVDKGRSACHAVSRFVQSQCVSLGRFKGEHQTLNMCEDYPSFEQAVRSSAGDLTNKQLVL